MNADSAIGKKKKNKSGIKIQNARFFGDFNKLLTNNVNRADRYRERERVVGGKLSRLKMVR